MANRLLFHTILRNNKAIHKQALPVIGNICFRKLHTDGVPVKEVTIPVQWGHIAGKLWGSDQERPILALHGWQDNAGTWDPLAPMLAKDKPILAVDIPGHGFSSWYPPGMQYFAWEFPRLILYIKQHFKWDKVSLLSHSMGSIAGLRFASIFPDDVDFYIAIDSLVYDDYDLELVVDKYPSLLLKTELAQKRLNEEPPSYTKEEVMKKWHLGTRKSVALESVHHLMKRGVKKSQNDANKYYFSRDSRIKHTLFNPEDKKFVEALVKRLKCPTLYIKGIDSPFASDAFSVELRKYIERNNDKFECHFVPGTHHIHLNNPEKIEPLVRQFLKKYDIIK